MLMKYEAYSAKYQFLNSKWEKTGLKDFNMAYYVTRPNMLH